MRQDSRLLSNRQRFFISDEKYEECYDCDTMITMIIMIFALCIIKDLFCESVSRIRSTKKALVAF